MRYKKPKLSVLATLLFAGIFICNLSVCLPKASAAGSASLSISPSKAEVWSGSDLIIKVHLNTGGEAVNAVQADISYPLDLFDPTKSSVKCNGSFPTEAQRVVNSSININGTKKGLVKAACGVAVTNNKVSPSFIGEADIVILKLHARSSAPSLQDPKMLEVVVDNNLEDGHNDYSAVARASDSSNILGNAGSADITVNSRNNKYSALDLNKDKAINVQDLSILINNFGLSGSKINPSKADINNDHVVNAIDLSFILSS